MTLPTSSEPAPYGLTRRETSPGRYSIDRFQWAEFPVAGKWVRANAHCIASNLSDHGSRRKAAEYVARFPGCRDPRKEASRAAA